MSRRLSLALRKISTVSRESLPPSYSRCDLRHIGLTINDHFNPPPSYDKALENAANANNGDYIANAYNNPSDLTRNCSRCSILLWCSFVGWITVFSGGETGPTALHIGNIP